MSLECIGLYYASEHFIGSSYRIIFIKMSESKLVAIESVGRSGIRQELILINCVADKPLNFTFLNFINMQDLIKN